MVAAKRLLYLDFAPRAACGRRVEPLFVELLFFVALNELSNMRTPIPALDEYTSRGAFWQREEFEHYLL